MNPYINNISPFGLPVVGFPPFPARGRLPYQVIDNAGIPVVCTTGIVEDIEGDTGVTYGINPCVWKALPCQCQIIWKVRHPISGNSTSAPVTIAIPSGNSSSTVSSSNSNGSTAKVPVVDKKGTQVTGSDVTNPTDGESGTAQYADHIVYIDKAAGVFRMLGVESQNSPYRSSGSNTPAQQAAVKSVK